MLEVLEQSIEAVGTLDRKAITDYIKSHTFQTLIGEVDIRSQSRKNFWTVGQWQNGVFEAVKGVKMPEGKPIRMKTGW
jgi:branched-chain amino acid transport system substrate-binding protein